ncbi:unnamed protein product [Plutella xylostella]|uniref:(diamondback moth) hypothetical protein n=1 Tax=Plutella xylostella TaxID=51655 RepID=A0A8S4GBU8_PLUXY|nr:unnamed protein product [Plutella xylostella]
MTLLVPDTSYSSSEGEDDFYDADDEPTRPAPPAPSLATGHYLCLTAHISHLRLYSMPLPLHRAVARQRCSAPLAVGLGRHGTRLISHRNNTAITRIAVDPTPKLRTCLPTAAAVRNVSNLEHTPAAG